MSTAKIVEDESAEDTNEGYRFEYFPSPEDSQWYWRLKAGNHEIMAVGGEGYVSKSNVERAIDNAKQELARAEIAWEE